MFRKKIGKLVFVEWCNFVSLLSDKWSIVGTFRIKIVIQSVIDKTVNVTKCGMSVNECIISNFQQKLNDANVIRNILKAYGIYLGCQNEPLLEIKMWNYFTSFEAGVYKNNQEYIYFVFYYKKQSGSWWF